MIGYRHSLTGMVLMFGGARHSLGARPRRALGLLCASYTRWAATFWRAATLRVNAVEDGDHLFYGSAELWVVIGGAVLALIVFGISLS